MSNVGQIERKAQDRVVKLFREQLGYEYLGNWEYREGNSNVEVELLAQNLRARGYDDNLINKAIDKLKKDASLGGGRDLYEANRDVYDLLRYGVKVKPGVGEQTETVWLIDWANPDANHFAVAEEVTVARPAHQAPRRRALRQRHRARRHRAEALEGRVSEGIRQTIGNQKPEFIRPFFTTVQLVMAGNDVEGLRYGVIDTPEKYWLAWQEPSDIEEPLDRALTQLCSKERLPGADPRLHGLRRWRQEDLPPQPVLRRQGRAGADRQARGRHHLAHPGLGQVADDGLAGQVDPRAPARRPGPADHRPHRTRRADREGLQRRQRDDLPHHERRRPARHPEQVRPSG